MIKRVIKITLLLLFLIVFDQSCTNRDFSKMPPMTVSRAVSLYSVYNPFNIQPAYLSLKEKVKASYAENAKEGGIVPLRKLAAGIRGFDQLEQKDRLSLMTACCFLLFIVAIIVFSVLLRRNKLKIHLEEKTRQGTSL